jgi:hypothetical protein
MQFEDYTTHDSALEVCRIQRIDHVLDQHLSRPEEAEEVAEHKVTFLDAQKELEAARNYMCHFDTENNISVMCNEVENELYRLRAQGMYHIFSIYPGKCWDSASKQTTTTFFLTLSIHQL